MKVQGDFIGPPRSTDKSTLAIKVRKRAKIRNQALHLTQDTNGKKTTSQLDIKTRAMRLSGDHKAIINRRTQSITKTRQK